MRRVHPTTSTVISRRSARAAGLRWKVTAIAPRPRLTLLERLRTTRPSRTSQKLEARADHHSCDCLTVLLFTSDSTADANALFSGDF